MRPIAVLALLSTLLVAWSEAAYYPLAEVDPLIVAFYAAPVWAFVWCLRRWPPAGWPGVVLAGAVYGFLVEGALVPVIYESPLFTVSYTSLAWHLLISVLGALVGIGLGLRAGGASRFVAPLVGLGVLLGVWWPAWWADAGAIEPDVVGFAWVVLTVTAVSAVCHVGLAQLEPAVRPWIARPPGRAESVALGAVVGLGWVGMSAVNPIAIVLLPALLAICAWGLRRGAAADVAASVLGRAREPLRWRRLPMLALVPVAATTTYAAIAASPLTPVDASALSTALVGGTQWLLGYVAFAWALWRAGRVNVTPPRPGRHGRTTPASASPAAT